MKPYQPTLAFRHMVTGEIRYVLEGDDVVNWEDVIINPSDALTPEELALLSSMILEQSENSRRADLLMKLKSLVTDPLA